MLILESRFPRPTPKGFHVDGNLVFDLDQDATIVDVDVHAARRIWCQRDVRFPQGAFPKHDLVVLPDSYLSEGIFTGRFQVSTDTGYSVVEVVFDRLFEQAAPISLSDRVMAWVDGQVLAGFTISLVR